MTNNNEIKKEKERNLESFLADESFLALCACVVPPARVGESVFVQVLLVRRRVRAQLTHVRRKPVGHAHLVHHPQVICAAQECFVLLKL